MTNEELDPLMAFIPAMDKYLGLKHSSAYNLIKDGKVRTVKVGRGLRIRQSELMRLQASFESGVAA